jgi:chromosome segregation ATPase
MRQTETKPTPDPTILTTEQLLREIANAVRLLQAEVKGFKDTREERDKAVDLRFQMIEAYRIEQKTDVEKNIAAALSAQKESARDQSAAAKEAVTKAETATAEQMKQQYATIMAELSALRSSLTETKERVSRNEQRLIGMAETKVEMREGRTDQRLDNSQLLALIVAVAAIAGLFLGLR